MKNPLVLAFVLMWFGVWTGVTMTAGVVVAACERDGKWSHKSFLFKPNTVRIKCEVVR